LRLVSEAIGVIAETSRRFRGIPWVVGYSGGKDSSAVLQLLVDAAESGVELPDTYVVYEDTLLEHPLLRRYALETLESLGEYSRARLGGVIKPVILRPEPGEDFISMLVLKGYPMPHYRLRWCMRVLKIKPARRFVKSLGRHVTVTGVRLSESAERARNVRDNFGDLKIVELKNPIVMPILDWSLEDVVEYLRSSKRWDGKGYGELLQLYGFSEEPGCGCGAVGNTRFGCWVCTVIRREKMPLPRPLREAKERLLRISTDIRYREVVDGIPRRLNSLGRAEVARVLLQTLKEFPQAFGYKVENLERCLETIAGGRSPGQECRDLF